MIGLLAAAAWAGVVLAPDGARGAEPRPTLSGPEAYVESTDGFFRVRYTLEGADAPSGDVVDGVPVAATDALAALVDGRAWYDGRGFRALVGDEGGAGSDAIDLYLHAVDINGYAHGEPVTGETDRGSCWIEVDNDLGSTGPAFASVVVHELHHCVQYRYTWEADGWFYEAQATYEQYLWNSDGVLAFAAAYLWGQRLEHPDWPIDETEGGFAYAAMTLAKFWEDFEPTGTPRLPDLWEALAVDTNWRTAFDTAAQEAWGLSFDEAFLEYSTWMAFACARDDGTRWADDSTKCIAEMEIAHDGAPLGGTLDFDVTHDAVRYTATYQEFGADGSDQSVAVDCDLPGAGQRLGVRIVAVTADGEGLEEASGWAEPGQSVSVRLTEPLDPEGAAMVVFASTGTQAVEATCTASRVDPTVIVDEPGPCGCSTSAPSWPQALLVLLALAALRVPTTGSEMRLGTGSPLVRGVIARYRGRAFDE